MRIGKLIITIDHTHDRAPHYGKHALKTSIIAVTVASALTLTVFAADYNSHGILKYDQNSDGTAEIELNGAEIQNLGAAAANQEVNINSANTALTNIQTKNTELADSTTELSSKVEGLANTVQASLAKNGVCMTNDGSSGAAVKYKQALASASSDYKATINSGSQTGLPNLNLSDSIGCINNIGKLPADHSDNVVGITALSDDALKTFTTAHPTAPTAKEQTAGNEKGINYTSQLMAGSGAWMADNDGLKWYEGTTVNKGSINTILTSDQNNITLPAGYYNGISVSTDVSSLKGNVTYTLVHHHTGNATSGGGCYSSPVHHVHSDACNPTYRTEHFTCRGWRNMGNKRPIYCECHGDQESWQYEITWQCNETGEIVTTQQWTGCAPCHNCDPDTTPWQRTAGPFYNCGKDESTIYYDPGCGLEEGDFVRETNDFSSINDNEKISKVTITY